MKYTLLNPSLYLADPPKAGAAVQSPLYNKLLIQSVTVWDEYSDIQIYSNIFGQRYSFAKIFNDFFLGEFIRIFICDLFILTNIFGYSFVHDLAKLQFMHRILIYF